MAKFRIGWCQRAGMDPWGAQCTTEVRALPISLASLEGPPNFATICVTAFSNGDEIRRLPEPRVLLGKGNALFDGQTADLLAPKCGYVFAGPMPNRGRSTAYQFCETGLAAEFCNYLPDSLLNGAWDSWTCQSGEFFW